MSAALERRPGALVDREAGPGDLGAAGVVEDVERLAEFPVGLARPGRAIGRRIGPDLALERHSCASCSPQVADRDVGFLATDRDVRVGRVRDAQEQVVEGRLGRRELGVEGRDPGRRPRSMPPAGRRPRDRQVRHRP